jgi:4a-hydroxytetrahydrobiopterin dehydratase
MNNLHAAPEALDAPLLHRRCRPMEGGSPLGEPRVDELLAGLPEWRVEGGFLTRTFAFADYWETIAFVNASAWISHREDHHPELAVGYNRCQVRYSTHSVGGLSENDFICAAKLDALFALC